MVVLVLVFHAMVFMSMVFNIVVFSMDVDLHVVWTLNVSLLFLLYMVFKCLLLVSKLRVVFLEVTNQLLSTTQQCYLYIAVKR